MDILIYILKCIFIYLVAWLLVRFIGKKSVTNMTAYDLVGVFLIVTVAAQPIANKNTTVTIIGLLSISISAIILGNLSLTKSFYSLNSKPTIVMANGKIIEKNLKSARINIPQLMSELRLKGYQSLRDVKYAIVEPNGKISIIADSQASPVTPAVMGIPSSPVTLSLPLILDGIVDENNLKFLQKDKEWLKEQLLAFNVKNLSDVLIAQYDSTGRFFVNLKNKEVKIPDI